MARKVIARIRGGLGNQLFCYAAGRRLALINDAELVIDDVTGFVRDRQYRRKYMLHWFCVPARKATPTERLHPLERLRRGYLKWRSRAKPFAERIYVEQERLEFDERVLSLKVDETLYLDGLWQSERYFKDVEQTIRSELRIIPPADAANQTMAAEIRGVNAVAVHMRWFDTPNSSATHNVPVDYYQRAVSMMERRIGPARYFVFSDRPDAARDRLCLPRAHITYVSHNRGDEAAVADLWLMTQCQHFITANSTFSWWAAWLGRKDETTVVTPDLRVEGKAAWGFEGLIPEDWVKV